MNSNDFREFGKAAIEFLIKYLETTRDQDVLPSVQPGYLEPLLPREIPEKPEDWWAIFNDFQRFVMPGITHWQSPNFHAYFPTTTSFSSIMGEMMSAGLGVLGFNWLSSPACTELEAIVLDWLARFFSLPDHFLNASDGPGGGAMQGSASEAILVTIVTAREAMINRFKRTCGSSHFKETEARTKLVLYTSEEANLCIEKGAMIASVLVRLVSSDNLPMSGSELEQCIENDTLAGNIPFMCISTLGTTGTASYDDIDSITKVCKKHSLWLHVDAAYSGPHLALDELREDLAKGLDHIDSINMNLSKNLPINFDSAVLWMRDTTLLADAFTINRDYMRHKYEDNDAAVDYRNWQIPLARRFRALKTWFTLRSFGAEKLRQEMRNRIKLADEFADKVSTDTRFEIVTKSHGLVCFRLKGENYLTNFLLSRLLERKKLYLHKSNWKNKDFLRFCVCGYDPNESDIEFVWNEILNQAEDIIEHLDDSKDSEII